MNLPLFIAGRYLFARKSHNIINVISLISVIGMAVGTAALVLILSVYNGFNSIVASAQDSDTAPFVIEPREGKYFHADSSLTDRMKAVEGVAGVGRVLSEQVFLSYDNQQGVARAMGIDESSSEFTPVQDEVIAGEWGMYFGTLPQASVSSSLARKMGIHPRFIARLQLWFPDRFHQISMSNPASSLNYENLKVASVFSSASENYQDVVIVPLQVMSSLLLTEADEVSSLEVFLKDDADYVRVHEELAKVLGDGFVVKDRARQNEALYKMMRYEKIAIYLILLFVVIVIAFNVFGCLSLLIIEKKEDISVLKAMGADSSLVRRIFVLEGWLISLVGMVVGLLVGILLAVLQMKTGMVSMPSGFAVSAFPVVINPYDIVLIAVSVAVVGYLVALLPVLSEKILIIKSK